MVIEHSSEVQKTNLNFSREKILQHKTEDLLRICNEALIREKPGFYYRTVSSDEFKKFLLNGELKYDGKFAFKKISEKLEFSKLPRNEKSQLLFNCVQKIFTTVLIKNKTFIFPSKEAIIASAAEAIDAEDLTSLVQLLRNTYQDSSRVVLGNMRYGGSINLYFSDYISTSLGSPLFITTNNSSEVILEFNRTVQEDDYYWLEVQTSEHEVAVLKLEISELTHVYSSDNWRDLLKVLQARFHGLFDQFEELKTGLPKNEQEDNSALINFFSNFLGQFHRITSFEDLLNMRKLDVQS